MSTPSVIKFKVNANEYVVFKFTIPRAKSLRIRMVATDVVNVLLLDSDDYADYKSGNTGHSYQESWGRRVAVEEEINVWPGTWYIVIEGRDETSTGLLEVHN